MRHELAIQTVQGKSIDQPLVLERQGDEVRILIDGGFAGRDVDEELPISAFATLLAGGAQQNHDLLGLSWATDGGDRVIGTIGVGSGYERFVVAAAELRKALEI